VEKIELIDAWFASLGSKLVWGLVILLLGQVLSRLAGSYLRHRMRLAGVEEKSVSLRSKILYGVITSASVVAVMVLLGFQPISIVRILAVVGLGISLVGMFLRRYYPPMPFKIGDTVELSGELGKVQAISVIYTQLKTFDGKTVFIPNRKIFQEKLTNFHFTPDRQIRLEIAITYGADLLKAKAVLSEIMAAEKRLLQDPSPKVYVIELGESAVHLSARGWVKNKQYLRVRCDLLETVKQRFDQEGISFAFPQLDVHLYDGKLGAVFKGEHDPTAGISVVDDAAESGR
jgi:small conductance mechanosensitive channel